MSRCAARELENFDGRALASTKTVCGVSNHGRIERGGGNCAVPISRRHLVGPERAHRKGGQLPASIIGATQGFISRCESKKTIKIEGIY